jgi:hypothetical protein
MLYKFGSKPSPKTRLLNKLAPIGSRAWRYFYEKSMAFDDARLPHKRLGRIEPYKYL